MTAQAPHSRPIPLSLIGPIFAALLMGCDNGSSQSANTPALGSPEHIAALEAQTTLGSGFATPNADGKFSGALTPVFTGSYKGPEGNGFAYEVARDGTSFSASAGLLPGTSAGDLPTTGRAAMSGIWNIAEIGKSNTEGREFAEAVQHDGQITLRADFTFGTLEGQSGDLNVLGRFNSATLTGDVYWAGRPAKLSGLIGKDRAIGVFHGSDSEIAFAGGFFVDPK